MIRRKPDRGPSLLSRLRIFKRLAELEGAAIAHAEMIAERPTRADAAKIAGRVTSNLVTCARCGVVLDSRHPSVVFMRAANGSPVKVSCVFCIAELRQKGLSVVSREELAKEQQQ